MNDLQVLLNYNDFRELILNESNYMNKLIRLSRVLCFLFFIAAFLSFAFIFFINALSSRKYGDKAATDFIYDMLRYTKLTKF